MLAALLLATQVLATQVLATLLLGCPRATDTKGGESKGSASVAEKSASSSAERAAPVDARIAVAVDPRVELISLLFRLADAPQYNRGPDSPYARAAQDEFARFEDHEAVVATRKLRAKHGISHDAPVTLALHLDGVPSLEPRRPLKPLPSTVDPRWKDVDIDAYLVTVRQFVQDTGFEKFIASHQDYYQRVEKKIRSFVADKDIISWYDGVLERAGGDALHLVPGLMTGVFNYGVRYELAGGKEQHYQVLMLERVDAKGIPAPSDMSEALLVHEMAHPFVNPAVEKHRDLFEASATRIFEMVKEPMRRQAYANWKTMVDESIVRALTVLYLHDRGGKAAGNQAAAREQKNAFHWIVDFTQVLARRRARGKITLDALMPEFAGAMDKWLAAHPGGPG